jgi:hypothetical protein
LGKLAGFAIFKDEAPYLLEWIAFHKMIGVALFVLYDNGSTDGGPWSDRPGQISAYRHFHANYADSPT